MSFQVGGGRQGPLYRGEQLTVRVHKSLHSDRLARYSHFWSDHDDKMRKGEGVLLATALSRIACWWLTFGTNDEGSVLQMGEGINSKRCPVGGPCGIVGILIEKVYLKVLIRRYDTRWGSPESIPYFIAPNNTQVDTSLLLP